MLAPEDNSPDSAAVRTAIRVVLFDYGQVLSLPPDPVAWKRMQQVTGLNEEQLHEGYWEFRHPYDEGVLNAREYWWRVAHRSGAAIDNATVDQLIELDIDLWTLPNPPMIAWARRLQSAAMRTAILSNIGDAMAIGITDRLAWLEKFDLCIWSYKLHLAKPDPEIFRATVEMLRIAPEQILFVDDKQENVAAAAGLGIQAIRYTTQAEFEQTMHERGLSTLLR